MENGRIKEKKNRQEFEHNLPGPTPDPPPEVETDIALDSNVVPEHEHDET